MKIRLIQLAELVSLPNWIIITVILSVNMLVVSNENRFKCSPFLMYDNTVIIFQKSTN